MDNARKHLSWPLQYLNTTCSLCNTNEIDTWPHVLLCFPQSCLHALCVKRHNKVVWKLRKLIVSSPLSRCYTLMNAGRFNNNPPDNIVPEWLLPCICLIQKCHCNARLRHDLLLKHGLSYQSNLPYYICSNLSIQFIEFTYAHSRKIQ
jgi:hypothetical protein